MSLTVKELRVLWLLTEETYKAAEQDSPKQKFHKELSDKLWAAYSEALFIEKRIKVFKDTDRKRVKDFGEKY